MYQKEWIIDKMDKGVDVPGIYSLYPIFTEETGSKSTKDNFRSLVRKTFKQQHPEKVQATEAALDKALLKLKDRYSVEEIKALANGGRPGTGESVVPTIDLDGDTVKLAICSDTHIGSKYTSDYHLNKIVEIVELEKPDVFLHIGDLTEGMSNRAGHVYELSHVGYAAQKQHAIAWLKKLPPELPKCIIDGNHDRWYIIGQNIGADIVQDVVDAVPNMVKIGSDTGFVNINGIVVQLWHGGDGASYARSYRIQKIVESLTGGKKPNMLITGHDHKEIYLVERNIHCIGAGSIQQQTDWMRGKKLSAHTGMWIVTLRIKAGRILRCQPEWIPFYA